MGTTYAQERAKRFAKKRSLIQVIVDELTLEHVQQGMTLLKIKHGDDFKDHINPESLNLESGEKCVLGQLYDGDYDIGVAALGLNGDAYKYGFNVSEDADDADDEGYSAFRELDAAWLDAFAEEYKKEVKA